MEIDNQSADLKSIAEENIVRQLGPELDSELATPQVRTVKQRVFNDRMLESNENSVEPKLLGLPQKKLKTDHGPPTLTFEQTPQTVKPRKVGNVYGNPGAANLKENMSPGFLWKKKKRQSLGGKRGRKQLITELTPEEGMKLLEVWEKNHFIDFNSWLQVAKAKVSIKH